MNPHPRYHFFPCNSSMGSLAECLCRRPYHKVDESTLPCNVRFEGDLRGPRSDTGALWNAIHEATRGNVHEVEAWSFEPRTWFHASDNNVILTHPVLDGHACNWDTNCTKSCEPDGH